jgi:hypothetical protein
VTSILFQGCNSGKRRVPSSQPYNPTMATTETVLPSGLGTSEITEPIPVPSISSKGSFSVKATITIAAPPSAVLKATLAHHRYVWNSFVPEIKIDYQPPPSGDPAKALWRPDALQPGTKFTMRVYMDGSGGKSAAELGPSRDNPEIMTKVEELGDGRKGYRVAWKSTGFPNWVLRCERVQEMVENAEGFTDYTTWETFGGPLAVTVKLTQGSKLVDRFADWARDLKRHLESSKSSDFLPNQESLI